MAQTGFTPIVTYNTATATTVPSAANLAQGELAVNVTDKKLYTKDSGGNVVLLASSGGDVTGPASSTNLAIPTFSGTGGKTLLNNSGVTISAGVVSGTGFTGALNGTLGATTPSTAVVTSINKMAITAPATSSTLAIADGKTHTVNNSIALSGTDSTTMTFPTTSATIARTDAAQTFTGAQTFSSTIGGATTIGVGAATPSASGAGITFPATQSASTNANTLDDYEEGSFTPTITASVTNPTNQPSLAVGRYTKIGGLVTLSLEITGINMAGSSGYLKVSSLPFANGGALYYKTTGSCYFNSIDTPAGSVNIVPFLANSASEVSFVATIDNAANQNVTDNATTGGQIYMSIAYRTT